MGLGSEFSTAGHEPASRERRVSVFEQMLKQFADLRGKADGYEFAVNTGGGSNRQAALFPAPVSQDFIDEAYEYDSVEVRADRLGAEMDAWRSQLSINLGRAKEVADDLIAKGQNPVISVSMLDGRKKWLGGSLLEFGEKGITVKPLDSRKTELVPQTVSYAVADEAYSAVVSALIGGATRGAQRSSVPELSRQFQ